MDMCPKKRILFVTVGTRGDVQPYVTLANGLVARGYETAIATHFPFESFVKKNAPSTQFLPLLGDPDKVLYDPAMVQALYSGSLMKVGKLMVAAQEEYIDENLKRVAKYGLDFLPDLVVATIVTITECLAICQKLSIPMVIASTIPYYPTAQFPLITLSATPYSFQWMNKASYGLGSKGLWMAMGKRFNRFRTTLGLPVQSGFWFDYLPLCHIYSPIVGAVASDWPGRVNPVGWITELQQPKNKEDPTQHSERSETKEEPEQRFDNDSLQYFSPSTELADFLKRGEKPIYVGFGSMPLASPAAYFAAAAEALKVLGKRGLFYSKTALEPVGDHMLSFSGAPHEWLLPQCAVAVHHGGAGTTAASIRAGIPTVIFPLLGDQPYWAARCGTLGVGPPTTTHLKDFTSSSLSSQLFAVDQEKVRQAAKELGERLRAEDGTDAALSFIERHLSCSPPKRELLWTADSEVSACNSCQLPFKLSRRRHHCRACGQIFCSKCIEEAPLLLWPASEGKVCKDPSCQSRKRAET